MAKQKGYKKSSALGEFFRRATKSFSSKLGVFLLLFIILACLIGPFIMPYGVNDVDLMNMYAGP